MWKTEVQSVGGEDLLEKEVSTHSSILAWRILRTEEPDGLYSMGSQRIRHDWATHPHRGCKGLPWWLSSKESCKCRKYGFNLWVRKIPWRRKWQPTPVLLPGESHGWRSLAGYGPWGCKESDTTEWLHFHFHMMNRCISLCFKTMELKLWPKQQKCIPTYVQG